jgi:hypothetical protein
MHSLRACTSLCERKPGSECEPPQTGNGRGNPACPYRLRLKDSEGHDCSHSVLLCQLVERSYIAVMVTISITADAFEAIKAALEPGESYSDVIVRMASARALAAAFAAASVAAWQSWRLADETIGAITHADTASEKQHQDTLVALKIASEANALSKETAERQSRDTANALALSKQAADATTKVVDANVAPERARLFFVSPS